MPLSPDEQRRLDEIERELQDDDPRFTPKPVPDRDAQRPTMVATTALFLGIVLLLTGLVVLQGPVALGVAAVMVGLSIMVRASARLIWLRHRT